MASMDFVETGNALQAQAVHQSQELMEELNGLALSALAEKLNDSKNEVVTAACWALASRGEEGKAYSDKIAAKVKDPKTRYNAVCALVTLDTYHKNVIECLSDPDAGTRCAAVTALTNWKQTSDAADVKKLLKNSDAGVRAAACLALGGMGHQNSASDIAALLSDKEVDSSYLAVSMGGAGGRPPAHVRKPRCAALIALGNLKSEAAKVAALTRDSDYEVRVCACEALGNMGDGDRVGDLASCLDDDTYFVRAKACEALGKLSAGQQVDRLADMLNDKSAAVRCAAAKAIGAMSYEGQKYLKEVGEKLTDPSNSVKGAAARALPKMGESAFSYASSVAAFLDNRDPFLRVAALEVLPDMGNYGAVFAPEMCRKLQDQDPTVRISCLNAMGEINIPSYCSDVKMLVDDDDNSVADAARKVLAATGWDQLAIGSEEVDHE